MEYFSKGKRGKIFLVKNIATKKSLPRHIKNEVKWLKILNRYNIGPKIISYGKSYFKYKFVKGKFILDYIKDNSKDNIKKVIIYVLKQCRILDKLKVNKKEMHNPYKHIIIDKSPVMIDFERCYLTNKPKNVSQFCQFLISNNVKILFREKNININKKELIKLVKNYKKIYIEREFNEIIKMIRKS